MSGLFLIARIADEVVAVPALDVGSVVEVDAITFVPRVAPHIAGLFALRSRVLTVVDTRAALGLGAAPPRDDAIALVTDIEGQSYALLVDAVDDVVEAEDPDSCPPVASCWRGVVRGTIMHGDRPILLVSPAAFVTGPEACAA